MQTRGMHDKQGGDTIVTIKRVREATAFRTRLADDSTVVAAIIYGFVGRD